MNTNRKIQQENDPAKTISGYGWGSILMLLGLAVFVFGAAAA